jgi:hypothetical protein
MTFYLTMLVSTGYSLSDQHITVWPDWIDW